MLKKKENRMQMNILLLLLLITSCIASVNAGDGRLRGIGNSTKVQEDSNIERHLVIHYDDRVEFKPTSKPWTGKLHNL